MKKNLLLEVSLPTNSEERIIKTLNETNWNNETKARILAHTNSLILAKAGVNKYQLYAMLIKDYILNKYNGNVKYNIEMDKITNSMDLRNDLFSKHNICLLMQHLDVYDETRYAITANYIENLGNKYNRYQNIKKEDEYICIMFCNSLNDIMETEIKKDNNYKPYTYRKVSSK